ncbi:MAG: beta-ketoacyl synthase chain length factor [Cardiobacteriaceae bacterium]|nr:beta-ketoacyl synthase chain length factor [Cardiobacteriaceae bacterium]
MCFDIVQWHAVSTRLRTPADWQAWAENPAVADELAETKPDVAFLPAMQRRRMGLLARLMFEAAWPLLAENAHCPLVLVSHDGEINRGFELWHTLYAQGDVSPTSFGLSVHNALAGQWSMLRGDMSEHTALAVGEEALETALMEAAGMLSDGAAQVLVVFADEPLAAQYDVQNVIRPPFAHAVALLIKPGSGWRLTRHAPVQPAANDCWSALSFVREQYRQSRQWVHHYANASWQWERA